jgi:hypothetical protein
MLTQHGERIVGVILPGKLLVAASSDDPPHLEWVHDHHGGPRVPDLSDPATLGCLLALVLDLNPGFYVEPCSLQTPRLPPTRFRLLQRAYGCGMLTGIEDDSVAAVLVAALESAKVKP